MKTQDTKKTVRKIIIFLVMAIAEFAITSTHAQDFHQRNFNRGSSKPVVALTAGLSTRTTLIKSDIDYINNMKSTLAGWESSLMFGGNNIRVRTGFGLFKTALSDVNSIKQASITGLVNIYVPGTTKRFRPYVITGLDVNTSTFKGTYVPESPLIFSNPVNMCTCQLAPMSTLPPPNPGDTNTIIQPEEPSSTTPEINSAKLTSTQLVSGLGGELNLKINGRFFSMFGEMRYGLPIVVTSPNASMNATKTTKNMALTFGVAIGLHGNGRGFRNGIR